MPDGDRLDVGEAVAAEILGSGTYDKSAAALTHGDLNACFAH